MRKLLQNLKDLTGVSK